MGKRKGKKTRTHVVPDPEETKAIPKSFVVKSGKVGSSVSALVKNIRKVMEPNTASKLKEQRKNKLKDYLQVAGQYGVSHLMIFTQTQNGVYMKLGRMPRGPTLNFKIVSYSLTKDVTNFLKRPKSSPSDFLTPPLLVLNNFGEKIPNVKLVTTMFQNMFPAINIQKMRLSEAKRVLLLNYNQETGFIDFRHYSISIKSTGLSKGIKKIVSTEIPSLGKFEDISEYILREAVAAESDYEDGPENSVTLPSADLRGKKETQSRAIKLTELGPRLELDLVKIQSGLLDGQVLYHKYIKKTEEEIKEQEEIFKAKKEEIEKRKKQQELNIQKKKEAAEAHRIACGAPAKAKGEEDQDSELEASIKSESDIKEEEEDNLFDEGSDGDVNLEDEIDDIKSEGEESEVYIKTEDEEENLFYKNQRNDDESSDIEIKEEELDEDLELTPKKKRKD